MIKKLFPFLSVIMLALFVGACSSEDVMPNIDQGASSRTVTFEGYMPTTTPSTRVVETPDGDRGYKYTWEVDDKLQLLFEQEAIEKTGVATVVAVDAKTGKGTFTLTLPEGIDGTKNYKLYGVINIDSNEYDVSSPNPAYIGILEDDLFVVFYFNKEVVNNEIGTVTFEHKTSIINVEIKVTDENIDLNTLYNVELIGDDSSNTEWAYEYSGNYFDLKQGKFTDNNTRTNSISFSGSGSSNGVWYRGMEVVDALNDTEWPALKLSISDGTNTYTTVDAKPARTPENGNNYYIYATFDGTDLVFTDKEFETGTKISIADLRAKYVADGTYAEDHYIEGEVILNPYQENTPDFVVYVADNTAGITLTINDKENLMAKLPLGAKVRINVQTSEWNKFKGLIQLGLSTDNVEIIEETSSTPLVPKVVSIQDVLDGNYQSELVQVNNVQFKNVPATYQGTQVIESIDSKELNVYTRDDATFAANSVMEGNGPIIGVVSHHSSGAQLLIRSLDDLAGMTNPRIVPPFINVTPNSLNFATEGGSETITVTSNTTWMTEVSIDANSWLSVSSELEEGNAIITVTATANDATDSTPRSGTITISDADAVTKTVTVTQAGAVTAFATDLFISEYVEGSSNNKWIEIFNGTGASINLSDYKIENYNNGSTSATYTLDLPDVDLENNKVYVIANNSASTSIYSGADLTTNSSVMGFNGNDAIVLVKNTTRIDIIGEIGNKANIIKDLTLIRKPHVKEGNAENYSGFPNEEEWSIHGTDYQELGRHTTEY